MKTNHSLPRRIMAAMLCLVMFATFMLPSYAAPATEKEFVIDNPYADVDWNTWGAYKAQLHCHTQASDGFETVESVVKLHYDLNYDILAITDHGTINKGWNNEPELVPLMRKIKEERTQMSDVIPLTDEAYQAYLNGTSASTTRTHQNGMLDVPKGIELNMATPIADCHLTGYFSDYGQGLAGVFGDYETPAQGVADAGGISMLSHVGEYVYTDKDSEKYVGMKIDDYYPTKFARLFLDNPESSVGMGINSATDAHTRCDRILYDQILQKTIPNGVVPWSFCFSDSHSDSCINDAYQIMMMDSLDMDTFRKSMSNGTSFAVSHYTNGVELNGMEEMPGYSEDYVHENRLDLLDNTPMVTSIKIDEATDTITITGTNFDEITWVSNCNVIKRESNITNGIASLDLHASDLLNTPELYVRFYITGDNGICYAQPFTLNVKGETFEPVEVPETHDVSTFLRGLVTVVDWIFFKFSPVIWVFKYFALGYNPIERIF